MSIDLIIFFLYEFIAFQHLPVVLSKTEILECILIFMFIARMFGSYS